MNPKPQLKTNGTEFYWENNEPVAWMVQYKGKHDFTFYKPVSHDDAVVIPLYAHPVKEYKEPSVKEIDDLWIDVVNNIPANDHRPREWHFANAILRKAQEK